jgi:hypothetical protein
MTAKKTPWNKGLKGVCKPNSGSFQKGSTPWNKGKKGYIGANRTSFKKGQISKNHQPIGTITIRKHKRAKTSLEWIKVTEPNKWVLVGVYVWEKSHGKIPKGMVLHFKDRNPLNTNLKNLELMTRAEHIEEHRKEQDKKKFSQSMKKNWANRKRKQDLLLTKNPQQKGERPPYQKCGIKPENYPISRF